MQAVVQKNGLVFAGVTYAKGDVIPEGALAEVSHTVLQANASEGNLRIEYGEGEAPAGSGAAMQEQLDHMQAQIDRMSEQMEKLANAQQQPSSTQRRGPGRPRKNSQEG